MFTIEIKDTGVPSALRALLNRVETPQPALHAVGVEIMERAKPRFATATGPDGVRWHANARVDGTQYVLLRK